ncbi:MAG TPA: hypothetical protein VLG47_07725 [Candidatus Saccharimonadales bacterium]|nr:hypothetical protein [Candidatus Saccharimonadales bacterium]
MSHEDPRVFSERRIFFPSQIVEKTGVKENMLLDFVLTTSVDDIVVRVVVAGVNKRLQSAPGFNERVPSDPSQFIDDDTSVVLMMLEADEQISFFYVSWMDLGMEQRLAKDGQSMEWPFYFQCLCHIDY